ncbi:RmlC-like cupin domain-containing protein, partial [Vararia minispora EC-137]
LSLKMADYAHVPPWAELIHDLKLIKHPEGGYFAETDRQKDQIPSPFAGGQLRSLATTIYYLLTYESPNGYIHMNKSVTMHVLHHGRSEYTLIHPPSSPSEEPRVERIVMGTNIAAGEVRQLVVGTGVWKMSRIPREDLKPESTDPDKVSCLITEVVFPGFHWEDHAYLTPDGLEKLLKGAKGGDGWISELKGYVKPE